MGWLSGHGRCVCAAIVAALLARTPIAFAVEGAGDRVTLLAAGARASIVFDLDDESVAATTPDTREARAVLIDIGPVRRKVANQQWHTAPEVPLVSEVRVRGVTQGTAGTIISVVVLTKAPVSATVRRVRRRLYLDLEPRDTKAVAPRTPQPSVAVDTPKRMFAVGASAASRPEPMTESPGAHVSVAGARAMNEAHPKGPIAGTGSLQHQSRQAQPRPPDAVDGALAAIVPDLERLQASLSQWQPGYTAAKRLPVEIDSLVSRLRALQPPATLVEPSARLSTALVHLSATWMPGPNGRLIPFRDDVEPVEGARSALRTFLDACNALE